MFHSENEIQENQEEATPTPAVEDKEVDLKQENQLLKQKIRQLTGENNRWEKKISNLNDKLSFWENEDLISDSLDKIKINDRVPSYFHEYDYEKAKELFDNLENFLKREKIIIK